jgi:hypothetical protein
MSTASGRVLDWRQAQGGARLVEPRQHAGMPGLHQRRDIQSDAGQAKLLGEQVAAQLGALAHHEIWLESAVRHVLCRPHGGHTGEQPAEHRAALHPAQFGQWHAVDAEPDPTRIVRVGSHLRRRQHSGHR